MKYKLFISILTVILLVTVLLFLVKDLLFYQLSITLESALSKAESSEGFCENSNPMCVVKTIDNLGVVPYNLERTFQTQTAIILADLVARVELAAKNNTTPTSPPNFQLITTLHPASGPVFTGVWTSVIDQKKILYIVFRGTQTRQEWTKDFETNQSVWSKIMKYKKLQQKWSKQDEHIQVHKGFLQIFKEFQVNLEKIIENQKADQVYVVGHSLGSAIATLTGLAFYSLAKNLVVYTFASPRVGNEAFSQAVQKNFKLYRISNRSDIVNDLPLAVMFNLEGNHDPFLYYHAGTNYSFSTNWGAWVNNHLLPVYTHCLNNTDCSLTVVPN